MQAELLRLQAVLRKTVVFITHDFDEAVRLAGRIAVMKDGKVVQVGSPGLNSALAELARTLESKTRYFCARK